MTPVTLTLELPEELAQEASELGLLNTEALFTLLRKEVDQQVMEMVNTEIQDRRSDKATTESNSPYK